MNRSRKRYVLFFLILLASIYCATNVFAARYYQLLQHERVRYLGLRGIDSVAAAEYLNLESAQDRRAFYDNYWVGKDEERAQFEERSTYAFKQFGQHAPLSDDRIPIYVKYGEPRKEIITPEKKVGVTASVVVHPAEIWTYNREGLKFDFVRMTRAYDLISQSEFGDRVTIPHFEEIPPEPVIEMSMQAPLDFQVSYGRFRQQKNLTRLEIYLAVNVDDTTDMVLGRTVTVFDRTRKDSLVSHDAQLLVPRGGTGGTFVDQTNLWLRPEEYYVKIVLTDYKNRREGIKEFQVNLIEYQDDAKEISDLIPARLIDKSFTHAKFEKPVGRVIPLLESSLPMYKPFYFYSEAYNLETRDGMLRVRTTYEVYNKERMRQEIVDVMIKDWIEPGNVAYLGTEYHPMDLAPGNYIIVLRVKDLVSGKERSAVAEFQLVATH